MPLLQINSMSHDFGGLRAVNNYNLGIEPGQIRGLIGPKPQTLPDSRRGPGQDLSEPAFVATHDRP
jgi:ABC-type phosphonate transport system ATPase subunit